MKIVKNFSHYIYFILRFSLLVAFVISIYNYQWKNAVLIIGIFLLMLAPSFFCRRFRLKLPFELELITVIFIYCGIFLGDLYGYYYKFWWWDLYLHFSSGILLGIFGFLLMYLLNDSKQIRLSMKAGFVAIFALTFAVTIGVMWEFIEYSIDTIFNTSMQKSGLPDTMWDLIMDFSGALIVSALGYAWMKQMNTLIFFDNRIGKYIQEKKKSIFNF